jgi:hypothetical protein
MRPRLAQLFTLLCALLLLSACASVTTPVSEGRLSPPAGHGLAIIAFTANASPVIKDSTEMQLMVQGETGKYYGYSRPSIDFIRAAGDTPNSDGSLLQLTLPAGRYTVVQASGSWQRPSDQLLEPREFFTVPIGQSFELAAGEVRYLGEVQLNINLRPDVRISQNTARDFYHLQVRHGVTDISNIQIRPLAPMPAGQ